MRQFLRVTALAESGVGLTLLLSPHVVARLLLGASLDAPALVVGRIAGAALLALATACWTARDDGPSRAAGGLVAAMLLYNAAAGVVLASAGVGSGLAGVLLWPAVALHAMLGLWCVVCLREFRARVGAGGHDALG